MEGRNPHLGKLVIVWDLASDHLQCVSGLPWTWDPRRKGLVSVTVDLFEHDSFLQILFPLSPPHTAPKAAEDLPIMRTQKIQECSTHCLWLLLLIV